MKRRSALVIPLAVVIGLAGSMQARQLGRGSLIPRGALAAPGWQTHRDPGGFAVKLPQGWAVQQDPRSGLIGFRGDAGEQAVVWPVFLPAHATLQAVTGASLLPTLAGRVWPDHQWQKATTAGARAVRALGGARGRSAVAVVTWAPAGDGTAVLLYALSAPADRAAAAAALAAGIFESFQLTGVRAAAAPPSSSDVPLNLQFRRWSDPREQAFTIDVPGGWRVEGGLFRAASVDVRVAFEVTSPDGAMAIRAGDPQIGGFVEPNEMLAFAGFGEGSVYSPGYGVQFLVRRYVSGLDFARQYVGSGLGRACEAPRALDQRDRSDAVEALNAVNAQFGAYGIQTRLSAGETAFACGSRAGYYFAATQWTQSAGGPAMWTVPYLYGYLSDLPSVRTAQKIMERIIGSFRVNPQWLAMQQRTTAMTSEIVTRTSEEISRIVADTYWTRQASLDETARRRSNATLEIEDAIDPLTGRELRVEAGSNYYWVDNRGQVVGSDIDESPGLEFRELLVW